MLRSLLRVCATWRLGSTSISDPAVSP